VGTRANANGIKQMRIAGYSPEKAGVGGSTPSLATIIPNDLAVSAVVVPVRSQSATARPYQTASWSHVIVRDLA